MPESNPVPGAAPADSAPALPGLVDRFVDRALRGLFRAALAMPYERRVPFVGAVARRLIAPGAGYTRRSLENLALIFPDMPKAARRRAAAGGIDNAGRTLIEIFSGAEFVARAAGSPVRGEGVAAVAEARAGGRPVILVSGHFGNFDVPRAFYAARGEVVAALYKPLGNEGFNESYVAAIGRIAGPVFPRGRQGLGQMIRHLREGGMLGLLTDQRINDAPMLDFLGRPALTALSAAELALRYDALLVPVYGLRDRAGLDFELLVEAPIPVGTAIAMMQAVNDSLAAQVRARPDLYFWVHRRWDGAGPG